MPCPLSDTPSLISPTASIASLSIPLHMNDNHPRLFHSLHQKTNSVLCLAADEHHIYSGSQGDDVLVWDKSTFTLKTTLKGHTASVLALEYAPDRKWLFSASGDSTVRVWSTETFALLYVLIPHFETDAGDLFSIAWCAALNTVYFGCQNTSLQWYTFPPQSTAASSTRGNSTPIPADAFDSALRDAALSSSGTSTPRRAHKFFDSYPQYTRRPADLNARNSVRDSTPPSPPHGIPTPPGDDACFVRETSQQPLSTLVVPPTDVIWSAHYGYVYCMALSPSYREGSDDAPLSSGEQYRLVTGSGDATVKLWTLENGTPTFQHTFDCGQGAVLALAVRGDTAFAGCQDGHVKVCDLETRTLVRTIIVIENVDVLALSMLHSDLYTCSANGQIQRYSATFDLTATWKAHDGIVLSSLITRLEAHQHPLLSSSHDQPENGEGRIVLITGANDDYINLWDVELPHTKTDTAADISELGLDVPSNSGRSFYTLVYALSKFISIPSVSGCVSRKEDCRQAAIWLRKCLNQLGANSCMLSTGDSTNPLVLATFRGSQSQSQPERKVPRLLFYGHYDVIPAEGAGWSSDPFSLYALNGYLYGRGITDNKGPIMAVACAAAELLRKRALDLDLVMLIEGEEEAGSGGFSDAVKKHKHLIGPIDAILVSNSTWISEDTPCITYGLRGVVHCKVEISSKGPDLHSGVDGGAAAEPMMDMVKLLGTLISKNQQVAIPGFYDNVRPLTEEERQLYAVLSGVTQTPASVLSAKWREPALTVHSVEVSGPKNSTVIPATVKARVSLRIVPDQDLEEITNSLKQYLESEFTKMQSPNSLDVEICNTADWWLGNLDDPCFKALETAIREEWNIEPLRIREGGSIPSVPYLEKEFECHALHLPLGQSTDQAHLPNERMSLQNLQRGKAVMERFLLNLAKGI
ncbi:Zn-dependent exopeptidase [Abortiporus biennis]|nr:Zn-dependent exopeptidase [Abortiporus biennis]